VQEGANIVDLNDVPFDLNEDAGFIPPNFFTNLMDEAIGETPDPPMIQQPTLVHGQSTREIADTGPFVATTNTTSVAGDENDDDALSQPNDHDSLELAREHYNAYAARTGFSIALNTNRRSTYTRGLFGLEGMIQGMGISLTRWLGIAKFSVWLVGFDVVGDSQCLVWLEG
jgi:hypothetical protein